MAESALTYPLDFIKTQAQLSRCIGGVKYQLPELVTKMYRGCSALVMGNAIRGMARFSMYNASVKFLTDAQGTSLAASQALVAGMMTGFLESLVIVPFENIKITTVERTLDPVNAQANRQSALAEFQLYQQRLKSVDPDLFREEVADNTKPKAPTSTNADANTRPKVRPPSSAQPIPRGVPGVRVVPLLEIDTSINSFAANVTDMYKTRGVGAFVQGFMPTMFRQVANSAVQFTTYSFFKQNLQGSVPSDSYAAAPLVLISSVLSSATVVAATQPIDVVKTRMMSINARAVYQNALRAVFKIFIEEGPKTFWAGAVPRFFSVSLGSTITFGIYELVSDLLNVAVKQTPFSS